MNKTLFNTGWSVRSGVPNPFGVIFGSEPEAVPVTLPQDEMILEDRDPHVPSGNQSGYYPAQSYTYEKKFFVPQAWKAKQNTLEFEGVMAQAMVYLNGELIATNHYGYSQFYAQLNPRLRYGEENVLQVIARGAENQSRWYPGGGIYRDVWLWQG
jgi:beta-galactosidase/beta-glucuronidase